MNGGYLLVNMHGMLFHPDNADIDEDLAYARWLGGSVVRVFATDSSGLRKWDGAKVGARIAEIAPKLRAAHLRMVVAFVNNHQAVPGEAPASSGWMDNYIQLLLPFYTDTWRGTYSQFVRDLVTTVQAAQAQDVIFGWELGNELHTPAQPNALIPFITQAAAAVRALDPLTPILPGTMGANHVEPGAHSSSLARWLYCEAPVDAYTLHAYDWVSRDRPGDMPIDWDLDNIVSSPCSNGRALPVIVEELGTSRGLAGVYTASDEAGRLDQERRQIAFVRQFPQVIGFGVWNGESPRLQDRTFVDTRRGLTSYGSDGTGGGSCYDPTPDVVPGARCQLEQLLRNVRFVRLGSANQWVSDDGRPTTDAILGAIDPVSQDASTANTLTIRGWVADPASDASPGVDNVTVFTGTGANRTPLATATMGLPRSDIPSAVDHPFWNRAGFEINMPLDQLPPGISALTLAAHSTITGTWLSQVQLVVPTLGAVPAPKPIVRAPVVVATPQPVRAEIQAPQPGDQVPRTFSVQVLAPNADRVDVFVQPDRDRGGRLVGSASAGPQKPPGSSFEVRVDAPPDPQTTLFVHVSSQLTGQEQVLTLPLVVK